MSWYGGGPGAQMWAHGGPWIGGPLCLLWIGLIAVGIFLLVRNFRDAHRDRARSILDERYARGELSSEEYRERADHLR